MRLVPVDSFEDYFVEYVTGHIYSRKNGGFKQLVGSPDKDGYLKVNLCRNGEITTRRVHQLVMESVKGSCPEGCSINHKDRNKENNSIFNLEYVTYSENSEHALSKNYRFLSPEGEVVEVFNLAKFCRLHNLDDGHMGKVFTGLRKSHKGWKAV